MDDDHKIAQLAEFYIGRMQHLIRLASVTDPRTLLGYVAAIHFEMRPRFDALRAILENAPEPAPSDLPN